MRIGSLFSGIGGLELGLERAIPGAHTVWQVEQDPYARAVLAKHWPDARRYTDVREFNRQQWLFKKPGPVEIICGGYPCTGHSLAGKRKGFDDPRSGLWTEYTRIIREFRPRFVVVENVSALRSRGISRVLGDLAACGYDAVWDCIPAQAVRAHHRRDRMFIVAWTEHHRSVADSSCNASQLERISRDIPGSTTEVGGREGVSQLNPTDRSCKDVADANCDACGELWCKKCQSHWALCGCPGEHEGDVINCPAEPETGEPEEACYRSLQHVKECESEPDVGRVANGVPRRVDRLRCLGNAVVPQVAEVVGRVIVDLDQRMRLELDGGRQ